MNHMSNSKEQPHLLVLHPCHLSLPMARRNAIETLERCSVKEPPSGWESLTLKWHNEAPPSMTTFAELVEETRRKGIACRLQDSLDQRDPVFGGTIDEIATSNFQMKCKVQWGAWTKEVWGPCRGSSVLRDLTEDVLFYRREACERSNEYDFRLTARAYRSYLAACISLVDAFINRHIYSAKNEGFTSPEFEVLKDEKKLEERMRLWWKVCSEDDPSTFFSSIPWCHLQELRTKRNEILHAIDPIAVYSLQEMQSYLNKVRTGVGESLLMLRVAHKKSTVGFVERLRTAPKVHFRKVRFKADGNHKIRTIEG